MFEDEEAASPGEGKASPSRIEMFKAVAAFEHAALKASFTLNGGALIAVVAFAANILSHDSSGHIDVGWIITAVAFWSIGLAMSAMAYGFGYWSQVSFFRSSGKVTPAETERQESLGYTAANWAYGFFILSIIVFIAGVVCMLIALIGTQSRA